MLCCLTCELLCCLTCELSELIVNWLSFKQLSVLVQLRELSVFWLAQLTDWLSLLPKPFGWLSFLIGSAFCLAQLSFLAGLAFWLAQLPDRLSFWLRSAF